MTTRIVSLPAVFVLLALVPLTAFAQQDQQVYTYVAEWHIQRAHWDEFSSNFEKNSKPVLDRLVADGTIIEWARTVNVVHTEDGATHSAWWVATSFAGTQRVLDELMKLPTASAASGVVKHHDHLLRSLVYRTRHSGPATGYLSLSYTRVKPGKAREWRDLWDKYSKPTLERLLEEGTILAYGIDVEHVHTEDPGGRYAWLIAPSAEAVDKVDAAFAAARRQFTPEAGRGIGAAFAETTVPEAHRDGLERVVNYLRK